MKEIWKPIKGFEQSHEISNLGNVRTINRTITRSDGIKTTFKGKPISHWFSNNGYNTIRISFEGSRKVCSIHRLVAENFIDNPNNFSDVNHIDGDKDNNSVNNLEWLPHNENCIHAARTGLRLSSKISPDIADAIREEYSTTKTSHRKLGKKYNVSHQLIGLIINRKIWA